MRTAKVFPGNGDCGISLRDHIALSLADTSIQLNDIESGVAIVGRPFPESVVEQVKWQFDMIAKIRYMYADAMLKASAQAKDTQP